MGNPDRRLRVLLIDDDEEEFLLTQELLTDRSYRSGGGHQIRFELEWASTYETALETIQKGQHDVYLLDYQLGSRDGLQLLREVIAGGCKIPIIMMTGQGNYTVDLEAMSAGATDYLAKEEVTAPLLERTIRYAIERKRTEDTLRRAHDELELRVEERTRALRLANHLLAQTIEELRSEVKERLRVEEALEAERKRLFSLLDELPAYVYLQAPDYSIRFANCHFHERFGIPEGRPCFEIIQKKSQPCEDCPTFGVFETRMPIEWEWTSEDGRSYQVYDYPFTDVDDSPLVLELGIDITRRKHVEAQLAQNYKQLEKALDHEQAIRRQLIQAEKYVAMGRMVASVAHELNNPLQTIRNCLFLSQQEMIPEHPAHAYLEMAASETQRLSKLVMQLRELIRPRRNGPFQALDLVDLLEEVHAMLRPQLVSYQVNWKKGYWLKSCAMQGVMDQSKQVFINISANALEAMHPDGGTLTVDLQILNPSNPGDGPQVGIRFSDTGPGISMENMPKVFEPFFTTKTSGLGLGLSICCEIVEMHGGRITVESQPSQGAAFTVWLPVQASAKPLEREGD